MLKTILSPEMELYLSPEVELLPICAWRLYPVTFRMLQMLLCTLPAVVPPRHLSVSPGMPLWTHSRLPQMPGVGKRQTELRNPAPCRHSVRTHPLAGPGGQRRGTGTLLHISHCLTRQPCVGAEHTFREERGWGKESKYPGNSYISFVCVFPLQHSWQPNRVLWPWKEPSCLSRQHIREKVLGVWKLSLLFKLVLFSASLRDS